MYNFRLMKILRILFILLLLVTGYITYNLITVTKDYKSLYKEYTLIQDDNDSINVKLTSYIDKLHSVELELSKKDIEILKLKSELSNLKNRLSYASSINTEMGLRIEDTVKYITSIEKSNVILKDSIKSLNSKLLASAQQLYMSKVKNSQFKFKDSYLTVEAYRIGDSLSFSYLYWEEIPVEVEVYKDNVRLKSNNNINPNSSISVYTDNVKYIPEKNNLLDNLTVGTSINMYGKKFAPGVVAGIANDKYAGFINFTIFEGKSMLSVGANIKF